MRYFRINFNYNIIIYYNKYILFYIIFYNINTIYFILFYKQLYNYKLICTYLENNYHLNFF